MFRSLVILVLVVMLSPQPSRAQDAGLPKVSLPPLPPLPGMDVPPLPVAEAPKLPQLKTIPEIPPAKQVGAAAPVEKGWMDKLKDMIARFEDKPASAPATQTAQAQPATKPVPPPPPMPPAAVVAAPKVALPPPPPMEPPVMDALNLGSETPTVDPDIFEFDALGKKTSKKAKATAPVNPLPLPPRAKKNSVEPVTVPVLPNPLPPQKLALEPLPAPKPLTAPAIAPLPAVTLPPPVANVAIPAPVPPLMAAKGNAPSVPLPNLAQAAPVEKDWFESLKEKAKTAANAIMEKAQDLTGSKTTQTANNAAAKDEPVKFMKPKPGITADAAPPLPKLQLPAIANKAPEMPKPEVAAIMKPPTLPVLTENKPPVITAIKTPAIPEIPPLAAMPPPVMPKTEAPIVSAQIPPMPDMEPLPKLKAPVIVTAPKIASTNKAPALPAIPDMQLPPKPEAPIASAQAPPMPDIEPLPKLQAPTIVTAPKVAAADKTPALPAIADMQLPPKPTLPPIAAKTPQAPVMPVMPPLPKTETATAKAPQIPALPGTTFTPPPLPQLSLGDVKLPGDAKRVLPPTPPIATATKTNPTPPAIHTKSKPEPETFEFGELNNKGKKSPLKKQDEPVIADINQDDPAFKFWKNHDFHTQVLPEVINRKDYESRNSHLPKAVYKEDLEQLLFVAIGRGDLNAIRALLNNGVDVESKNAIGDTPLVHAAVNGQAGAVRVLLARGANPNNPNVHGMTAMQVAAERGREDIIDALFEMGAKATADYRNPLTPLQSGVGRGYASVYNAMQNGENPQKKQLDARDRALQALADAGPAPRTVISNGPGLSQQIIDDQAKKKPGEPLTFEEIERKLAYQEYVRKTGDDPAANVMANGTIPKVISPAGAKSTPVPIPYASPQQTSQNPPPPPGYIPPAAQEPIVGLPKEQR